MVGHLPLNRANHVYALIYSILHMIGYAFYFPVHTHIYNRPWATYTPRAPPPPHNLTRPTFSEA